MKQLIIVLGLIFICLSAAFSTRAQEINVADSLVAIGNFELATVYYEKAIFSSKEPKSYNLALFKLAQTFKKIEKFQQYALTLERVNKSILSKVEKAKIFYELAFAYYMSNDYTKAQFNWLQFESYEQELNNDALVLKVLLFAKLEKWNASHQAYIAFSNDSSDQSSQAFKEIKSMKMKSPEKAENLSYFLPGVGQMYAGKPLRGVTSLALQSGMLAFAAFNFLSGYYISGTFTGVSLFYVLYMGGARHAGYLAEEYNIKQKEKAIGKIRSLIVETKKGQ